MKRRLVVPVILFVLTGCVKETYNMDKLSKEFKLSPSLAMSVVRGDISLKDLVKSNDTIKFDNDNFVRFVFKKDSVIDKKLSDLYDLEDMVSFNQTYVIGELDLAPFSGTAKFPINQISSKFTPPVTYTTGTYPGFPSFPSINVGEAALPQFPNFQYATFSAGTLEIQVKNNLPVTIGGMTLKVLNSATHAQIGNDIPVPSLAKGATGTASINLKDRTIPSTLTIAATIHATTGTAAPVQIDLNTTNIEITISGKNLKVKSGRVILPVQQLSSLDEKDTIEFDPGNGIELDILKIITGTLSYTMQGNTPLKAVMAITLPTGLRNGVPVSETITVSPGLASMGSVSLNSTIIDLGTITTQPFNALPVDYSLEVSSDGSMVNFDSSNEITLDFKLLNPDFDYVKGYFGQRTESLNADSLDLEIKDILNHISGDFFVADPQIRLNYSNSFAIPVKVAFDATGIRGANKIDLGFAPFVLSSPAAPAEHEKNSVLLINKDNSELPEIFSMPPEKVRFSGSALMNPDGNTGARDNYVFGDSRLFVGLEVEVPFELRINNLQFSDTLDNFLKDDKPGGGGGFGPGDIEQVKIFFNAENGFPVGLSLSMSLYDPVTRTIKSSVVADKILEPAPVDNNGKVTGPAKTETVIDLTSTFWNSVNKADDIIFKFTVNTTGSSLSKNIKIYSDYSIKFNVAVAGKADLNL